MKFAIVSCFVTVIAVGTGPAAKAVDASYIGTWKLTGAVVAPWADPKQKPDSAEMTRLLNKTVVFQARRIAGPPDESESSIPRPREKKSRRSCAAVRSTSSGEDAISTPQRESIATSPAARARAPDRVTGGPPGAEPR